MCGRQRRRRCGARSRGAGPGVITERDVLHSVGRGEDPDVELVADHLTARLTFAAPDWSLEQAAATMVRGGFRHLVVVDGTASWSASCRCATSSGCGPATAPPARCPRRSTPRARRYGFGQLVESRRCPGSDHGVDECQSDRQITAHGRADDRERDPGHSRDVATRVADPRRPAVTMNAIRPIDRDAASSIVVADDGQRDRRSRCTHRDAASGRGDGSPRRPEAVL